MMIQKRRPAMTGRRFRIGLIRTQHPTGGNAVPVTLQAYPTVRDRWAFHPDSCCRRDSYSGPSSRRNLSSRRCWACTCQSRRSCHPRRPPLSGTRNSWNRHRGSDNKPVLHRPGSRRMKRNRPAASVRQRQPSSVRELRLLHQVVSLSALLLRPRCANERAKRTFQEAGGERQTPPWKCHSTNLGIGLGSLHDTSAASGGARETSNAELSVDCADRFALPPNRIRGGRRFP